MVEVVVVVVEEEEEEGGSEEEEDEDAGFGGGCWKAGRGGEVSMSLLSLPLRMKGARALMAITSAASPVDTWW